MQVRSQFLRVLPLLSRNSPRFFKICRNALLLSISAYWIAPYIFKPISCSGLFDPFSLNINVIKQTTITVVKDGQVVGYAFSFAPGFIVTVINEKLHLFSKGKPNPEFEFFMNGQKLKGFFKPIGDFQNLTFFQYFNNDNIVPLAPNILADSFDEVEILEKKQFLSINKGFLVDKDVGFKIVDGEGKVGDLVTKKGIPVGIVTHIGHQKEKGFLRIIQWIDLLNVAKRLKRDQPYLGISASSIQGKEGVAIVRVSANSPMKNDINLGDVIVQVNNQKIRSPDDLYRMIMLSENGVKVRIQYENIVKEVDLVI